MGCKCWDKYDRELWGTGKLPRYEKAVNYLRHGGCCNQTGFFIWRTIAMLTTLSHWTLETVLQFDRPASSKKHPHFLAWEYLTVIGVFLTMMNFQFLFWEHVR